MSKFFNQLWYHGSPWQWLLLPFSGLYWLLARLHRLLQGPAYMPPVPTIIVGNLTVGGTGKTPVCLALAQYFREQGLRVVILSRGYQAQTASFPLLVKVDANPREVGDEALLLAQQSQCQVVIDPQRVRSARYAVTELGAQLLLCDDGLQHQQLGRHVEIVVVDGERGLGNGLLLPAGPLRESAQRLATVDFVISNGPLATALPLAGNTLTELQLEPVRLRNLQSGECLSIASWQQRYSQQMLFAVAGIGNPQRFFASLQQLGFMVTSKDFADHHAFSAGDFAFAGNSPVLMTSKDAVKCQAFAKAHWWALEVAARLPPVFYNALQQKLTANVRH